MFQCTPDSTDDSIRVPICTPSAPSANAAAIERPSAIPPAATIGTSSFDAMSGSSTIDVTSRGFLKPAPSLPSTTSPSTPASTARWAPFSVGTTWNTISPASLRIGPYLSGDPADVVTNSTPSSTIICDDVRVAQERQREVDAERLRRSAHGCGGCPRA